MKKKNYYKSSIPYNNKEITEKIIRKKFKSSPFEVYAYAYILKELTEKKL